MQTDIPAVVTTIWGLATVAAFVFVFQVVLWPTLADELRLRLFTLRRRLFLYMASGRIAPNHPAYVQLRTTINSMIFFADRLSFTRAALDALVWRKQGAAHAQDFAQVLSSVSNPEVRAELAKFNDEIHLHLVRHLVVTSPVLWAVLAVVTPVFFLLRIASSIRGLKSEIARVSFRVRGALMGVQAEADALANAA